MQWRLVTKINGGAAPENCIFFINWGMATDVKLKDYILYKYIERIKEKRTHMLSIISTGNRRCCSSTVPIREPPLVHSLFQTEFSEECDPELPPSTSSILLLPSGHPTAAYFSFLAFLPL
jgi:hypothetical protein